MSATKNITAPHVFVAISEVMAKLAAVGISKDRRNQQQNYSFRGIDDVYNTLCQFLSEAKLLILPRAKSRVCSERETKSGGTWSCVVLEVDFDLISAVDGSKHTITQFGEGMDSADKATNKASSAAYKYACIQAFCIPVEGLTEDADSTTPPQTAAKQDDKPSAKPPEKPQQQKPEVKPLSKEQQTSFIKNIKERGWTLQDFGDYVVKHGQVNSATLSAAVEHFKQQKPGAKQSEQN